MSQAHLPRVICILLCSLLLACGSDESATNNGNSPLATEQTAELNLSDAQARSVASLLEAYVQSIDRDFSSASLAIETFAGEVERFLAMPDETRLGRVRSAWLEANTAYELTTMHRLFMSTVLNDNQRLRFFQIEYQLNHWPILPGYIDYVDNYPDSGIVNDMTVSLEADNLRAQHGAFDINEAALGFHVLEYLLWGETTGEAPTRPASDFQPEESMTAEQISDGLAVGNLANNRRRDYLRTLTLILQEDFANLLALWAESSVVLRANSAAGAEQSLQNVLVAMTGLLRERIMVSSLYLMLNGEFEESRSSIFSETSQNAVIAQLTGLELLLLETGQSVGQSFNQLFNSLSQDYEDFFLQNLDASKECLVVLYSPSTREGMNTSEIEFKVVECINSLTNMIDYLEQVAISPGSVSV